MRSAWFAFLALLGLVAASFVVIPADRGVPAFIACEIYIDSGDRPLGAYQLEVVADRAGAKIVGVEGGYHEQFKDAPFYDPAALNGGRIVIGALSLAEGPNLPRGEFRAARVHFMVDDAQTGFAVKVHTAGDERGAVIEIKARAERAVPK